MTGGEGQLVSVVMPSYNHAAYIGRAVASVLAQTHSNLELIVVDNRSSDGTDAALAAVKDPRLKVLKIDNGGIIAASRNLGVRNSSGKYVAFIDSDDVWLPGKLEEQLRVFVREPEAALVYSRFRTLSGEEESAEVFPGAEICADGEVFGDLYLKTFVACSGVLALKAALERAGGFSEDRDLVAIEDTDLWLRISRVGKVFHASDEPLFLYRVHPGNLSQAGLKAFRRGARLAWRHAGAAGPALFLLAILRLAVSMGRRRMGRL